MKMTKAITQFSPAKSESSYHVISPVSWSFFWPFWLVRTGWWDDGWLYWQPTLSSPCLQGGEGAGALTTGAPLPHDLFPLRLTPGKELFHCLIGIVEGWTRMDTLQEFPKLEKRAAHVQLERHPTNFKKSKSEKSKSILFDFSIFRNSKRSLFTFQLFDFRLFEIENDTVPLLNFSTFWLFDFSELTMKPLHFSTFYFSNFPVTCSTFSLSFSKLLSAFAMEEHLLQERRVQQKPKVNKWNNASTQTHVMLESQIHPNTK